jgi:hypothetical protein
MDPLVDDSFTNLYVDRSLGASLRPQMKLVDRKKHSLPMESNPSTSLRENRSASVFPTAVEDGFDDDDADERHTSKCFAGLCGSCENLFNAGLSRSANIDDSSKIEWSMNSLSSSDNNRSMSRSELSGNSSRVATRSQNEQSHGYNTVRRTSSTLVSDEHDQIDELFVAGLAKKDKRVAKANKLKESSKPIPIMSNSNKMYIALTILRKSLFVPHYVNVVQIIHKFFFVPRN